MLKQMSPLAQRLIVGSAAVFLALLAIFLSPFPFFKPFFTAIIAGSIGMAMWELFKIAEAKGFSPAKKLSLFFGCVYAASVSISTQFPSAELLPELVLLLSLFCCFVHYFIGGGSPFINLSLSIFSLAYLAVPLSCMLSVTYFFSSQSMQDGRCWIFYLLLVTKMTDTGAYFIGRAFGHQKMAPIISPKKTWEGAIGGLVVSIATSLLFTFLLQLLSPERFQLSLWQSIWLGASLGILAQCGDLAESLLKRDAGIKDSNRLPGLGGMLDTVDSLVFTAPFMYMFLKFYFPPLLMQ
jgi:phosphatidate cytidylyltransferase